MTYGLTKIIASAEVKFGPVIRAAFRAHSGDYVLMISLDEPANDKTPYTTIRGYVTENDLPAFQYGHYDLTEQHAITDFNSRLED